MSIHIGLDIGVASVGWAVVDDDYNVLESGSNIFEQKYAGENENRRAFRQRRRLLRRQRTRLNDFYRFWLEYTDYEPDGTLNNPLELRVKGLKEELSEHEIYTVLYNMLKHRGISYLEDALDDSTSGKSDYEKGLMLNQNELKDKYPCQIQFERLQKSGSYRGNSVITENGESIVRSNIFTISSYKKELEAFFEQQKKFHMFIDKEFIDKYMSIYERKRKYYEGPGNEKSRTDYGIYTTNIDPKTGDYITEKNIFDKLIGKCSVYPDEIRAAGASFTAQEFNALNDLNNITINNRKLEKEEKEQIVKLYLSEKTVDVRKIIKKVIGEEIESLTGARKDKSEKELFHKFETFRKMKKAFEQEGLNINNFSRNDLDIIGHILTINTDREAIEEAFEEEGVCCTDDERKCFVEIRKKNGSLFNKWQSFSLKIMNELIPQMYEEPKEQMTILTEMGIFKSNKSRYIDCKSIPAADVVEEIFNPVVQRSVSIAVRIVNELIKKYGYPKEIVIEMPRDKNDDEKKKRINDLQKKNEKELKNIIERIKREYDIDINSSAFRNHNQLTLKLKLWNEQGGKCLYSGKSIQINELLNDRDKFEIDHIIPRSISLDDSRANKVLVYSIENQEKGNKTPYFYLRGLSREWEYEKYKSYVLSLDISRKKKTNLLFTEDITKIDVVKGFISRNLNDTRYASRVVLNTLQDYFDAKDCGTKVKVVRGSFTNDMRKTLNLPKSREESYAHHAVDAMLICFSQMGYDEYQKMQADVIDWETGEIIDEAKYKTVFSDDFFETQMYTLKWWDISQKIREGEKKIKYWHKVDKKFNRALCNQTIRGTRSIEDQLYKINKADIRTKEGYALLKKKVEQGKAQDFLMAIHDPRTFESLIKIMHDYSDADNPFVAYENETGDYVRKYSKKGNGPRIAQLKYKDGLVGSCIDISTKYGHEEGSRKVILESLRPYRMDVYYNEVDNQYYLIGIKYSDCKFSNGNYVIDEEAYNRILVDEKLISEKECYKDLIKKGIYYKISFYENEIIKYEKNGEYYLERFLSRSKPNQRNYIETKPITKRKFEKQNLVGLSKTTSVEKIIVDILGNYYSCKSQTFSLVIDKL